MKAKEVMKEVVEELKLLQIQMRNGGENQQDRYDFLERRRKQLLDKVIIEEHQENMKTRQQLYNQHKQSQHEQYNKQQGRNNNQKIINRSSNSK